MMDDTERERFNTLAVKLTKAVAALREIRDKHAVRGLIIYKTADAALKEIEADTTNCIPTADVRRALSKIKARAKQLHDSHSCFRGEAKGYDGAAEIVGDILPCGKRGHMSDETKCPCGRLNCKDGECVICPECGAAWVSHYKFACGSWDRQFDSFVQSDRCRAAQLEQQHAVATAALHMIATNTLDSPVDRHTQRFAAEALKQIRANDGKNT